LSFFVFVVKSNTVSLREAVYGFAKIRKIFLVEKRIKVRHMQMACNILS